MTSLVMTMHPAAEGDAITLSWGPVDKRRYAVIDLGRTKTYGYLRPRLASMSRCELFVMTHIDADHIAGAMPLVREAVPVFDAQQVWFNGYHHLFAAKTRAPQAYETFSPLQGEKLSAGIRKFGWSNRWNKSFFGGPVSTDSPMANEAIPLEGGLSLRLLSPSDVELAALEPGWRTAIVAAGLLPDDADRDHRDGEGWERFGVPDVDKLAEEQFDEDIARPNGSSIGFLAEFDGKRLMLTGDAHPGRLEASLRALGASETKRLKLDCLKVSHHGSKANTSPGLLSILDCVRFAFSTDGTKHGHPDPQTIARILKANPDRRKELIFNFRQPSTAIWDDRDLERKWNYSCTFPTAGEHDVEVTV